jgi:hypothetical protein
MLKRVISYLDGRVVYYYNTKEVIYTKDHEPVTKYKNYNKKDIHEFCGSSTNIRNSITRTSRH